MNDDYYIDVLRTIWTSCQIGETFAPQRIGEKVYLCSISEGTVTFIRAVWAQAVYRLCSNRLIGSAFEVPFQQLDGKCIIWIKSIILVFVSKGQVMESVLPDRPEIIPPVMVAIGGPTGVGKTTVVKRMKQILQGEVLTYPAFTTRPIRFNEQDGIDYHFRSIEDFKVASQDSRYTNFVKARDDWYWINPSIMLESIWENPDKIHIFFISQRNDFEYRRALFPQLRWIWLYAKNSALEQRLGERGDGDIASSLAYNRRISNQAIDDLVDIYIENQTNNITATVERIMVFCKELQAMRRQ